MRYSTEPRFKKYVKGYDFLSFAEKIGNKYGKKLMDTATKTGINAAKIASKRVVQKTAEAAKNKEKEKSKPKEIEKIYIPPEKENKLVMILDYFECNFIENKMCSLLYKNGISKNFKFSWHNIWW